MTLMHFTQLDEYIVVSRITGPRHNLLQLRLCEGRQKQPFCEKLPSANTCKHELLAESEVIASICAGVAEANQRLGTGYAVTHIRYIDSDTKPESIYGEMAIKLIEHIHGRGGIV